MSGQASQTQPLPGKVAGQCRGSRIRKHAPDLCPQHIVLAELAGLGQAKQPIVRNTAPQKERQPRSQIQIADAVGGPRCQSGRRGFPTIDELRIGEHALHDRLDAIVE